ncbi:MAG: 4-hydroxy-tetrahydrodipicolinate reductase [Chloroflexi bacterium]|nr:4-hydroxy-tetrahydrodipicolinate reductase [Chloroflexota bacterium]
MSPVTVIVNGALGKMGQTMCAGLGKGPDTAVVGGADVMAKSERVMIPGLPGELPLARSVDELLGKVKASVLVDFSTADAVLPAVRAAAQKGVSFVVGTTGLSDATLKELEAISAKHKVGGMAASNFALGAVVMMHLAQLAAKHFDYAEIIETHHETKIDAPSGTAKTTAEMMSRARGKPFKRNTPEKVAIQHTRDGQLDGVTIHSVRLPGTMAHQEVIFGHLGQTLSIRHDTINRDCYVPGVLLAVKHVAANKGFLFGLDRLLGL